MVMVAGLIITAVDDPQRPSRQLVLALIGISTISDAIFNSSGKVTTEIIAARVEFPNPEGQFLAQRHVQNHHHGKTQHSAGCSLVGMFTQLGLWDQLFDHHKDHRSGGKSQGIGQNGGGIGNS